MLKNAKNLQVVVLFLSTIVCFAAKIPKQIGDWYVIVGSAGNSVYQPSKTIPKNTLPSAQSHLFQKLKNTLIFK